MARKVTEIERHSRSWTAMFLRDVFTESGVSVRALDEAYRSVCGSRKGDRRSALQAYQRGDRTMTADVAVNVGEAFNQVGISWVNAGVMLYAAGHFGEWVRYLTCLRRISYPAALVSAFTSPELANPMYRAMARQTPGLPEEQNFMIRTLMQDAPRSNVSRISTSYLSLVAQRWHAGESGGSWVDAAMLLSRAKDLGPDLRENMCVSLGINAMSKIECENDLRARPLFEALYEAYGRRLPMFRPAGLLPRDFAIPTTLTVGGLDRMLDQHLPLPQYRLG